jgi:hypothetical protein
MLTTIAATRSLQQRRAYSSLLIYLAWNVSQEVLWNVVADYTAILSNVREFDAAPH